MLPVSNPQQQPGTPGRLNQASTSGRGGSAAEIEESSLLLDSPSPRRAVSMTRRASSTQQAAQAVLSSYVSKRFMSGCAILLPMVITVYITWWFIGEEGVLCLKDGTPALLLCIVFTSGHSLCTPLAPC